MGEMYEDSNGYVNFSRHKTRLTCFTNISHRSLLLPDPLNWLHRLFFFSDYYADRFLGFFPLLIRIVLALCDGRSCPVLSAHNCSRIVLRGMHRAERQQLGKHRHYGTVWASCAGPWLYNVTSCCQPVKHQVIYCTTADRDNHSSTHDRWHNSTRYIAVSYRYWACYVKS